MVREYGRENMGERIWAREYGRENMGERIWAREYGREYGENVAR
jgi:hypothetical protein